MRQEHIESIIAKRKPMAERVAQVENQLAGVLDRYAAFRGTSRRLLEAPGIAGEFSELTGLLTECDGIAGEGAVTREDLRKIRERLQRGTLNIAVIGRARQGKSRLLQSVTGLSDEEIPSGDVSFCTGVRSDIINKNCETYAVVHFLSEEKFLKESIKPYFDELSKPGLFPPMSVSAFRGCRLPQPGELETKYVDQPRLDLALKHLKNYQEHLPEYESLLGRPPQQIRREDIREYVAQDNKRGDRVNFKHLAVDKVEIYCRFPNTDVGCLRLIDLPGLGDTRKGDVERVVSALSDQVDLVFFLSMPENTGAGWDDKQLALYSEARSALGEKLPIEKWSFWVFNRKSGFGSDNAKQCEYLKNAMPEAQIAVSDSVIVNCADAKAVSEQLIDKALDYLAANIADNDAEYARNVQNEVSSFATRLKNKLEQAQALLSETNAFVQDGDMFDTLFDELWEPLTVELEGLVGKGSPLREQRNNPCAELEERVEAILRREEDGDFPITEEKVKRLTVQRHSDRTAYDECLHELRTRLSSCMQEDMDDIIDAVLKNMKSSIGSILGKTGRLEARFGPADDTLLVRLIEYIESSPRKDEMPQLLKGLKLVSDWKMSYRSFVQHRIRAALGSLDPLDDANKTWGTPNDAEQTMQMLQPMYYRAISQMREQFAGIFKEPNQAAFAVAEEFTDIVLRSSSGEAEKNKGSVVNQWRRLYRSICGDVWPDEFGAKQATREVKERLNMPLTTLLDELRNLSAFTFTR